MNQPVDPQSNKSRRQTTVDEPFINNTMPFSSQQNEHQLTQRTQSSAGHMMSENKKRSMVIYNHITYLLYILSYFTAGLLWIVPIMMNYGKRHDVDNTWLATHFDWQIKTFWYSIVLFAIGAMIIIFALSGLGISVLADSGNLAIGSILLTGFGLMIMVFTFIWHLYRIVRGWIALTDNRPVP